MRKITGHLAVLAATVVAAGAADAREFPVKAFDALGMAGSERLVAYALTREETGPAGLAQGIDLLRMMGFIGAPGEITDRWFNWSPVLTYDGNLNGGFAQDSFIAGGLPFEIDDELVSVGGMLVGVSFDTGLRMNLATDTALELRAASMLGFAPEHDIAKSQIMADACVKHMVTTETFLHGCADILRADYELGTTERAGARFGMSHAFMSPAGFHEVAFELQRLKYLGDDGYGQNIVSVRSASALSHGLAFFATAQLGEDAGQNQVMRRRLELGVATTVKDRGLGIRISAEDDRGGMFLGEERRDMIYGVNITGRINEKLSASAFYSVTDASHEFYKSDSIGFSFDYNF
ncbi:hypothetical protein ACEUZ9_004679 [Paracoccus litorisediminis]|uniref:hypothetical protein n=1 Tax=Paracoccus litorisediminis TaxID=2006130 RepID=UPI0037308760